MYILKIKSSHYHLILHSTLTTAVCLSRNNIPLCVIHRPHQQLFFAAIYMEEIAANLTIDSRGEGMNDS